MSIDELRECTRATLTLQEVAETLSVDYRTVGRACNDGSIPSISLGRRVLIPTERFRKLLIGNPTDETDIPPYAEGLEPHAEHPRSPLPGRDPRPSIAPVREQDPRSH